MKFKIIFASVLLLLSGLLSAKSTYVANKTCPAALTLSSFQKAMTASFNHQNLVFTKMMAEGDVLQIHPRTRGEFLERSTIMNGQLPVVRFAYSNNPNGFYGVWTLENCFSHQKKVRGTPKKSTYVSTWGQPDKNKLLIKSVQIRLNIAGFNAGAEDGALGAKTIRAIKQFQKLQGMKVDGKVTKILNDALYRYNIGRIQHRQ